MEEEDGVAPELREGELMRAIRLQAKKNPAPGPDGVPGKIWAGVYEIDANCIEKCVNKYLEQSKFPRRWKVARLVLLDKGKGPPITSSSFRPICLLDTMSKVFERMIAERLMECIKGRGGYTLDSLVLGRDAQQVMR